ncbi:MAG: glycosyltransferase family 2 protein [Oscillospiraceae bacterium]|nr:glycosyltransferase family 2 protein [Oscillospiraceae bacterium]
MRFVDITGVPDFECYEFKPKNNDYCLLIPILNEKGRILPELQRAVASGVADICDIIIIDGGSTDGCCEDNLFEYGVNTLLIKTGEGKQGAQLRCGFFYAEMRNYTGYITIDGNNKDSIEDVGQFITKLEEGYDFIQGSRYMKGGSHNNTPLGRQIGVRLIHVPTISKAGKYKFSDTTNGFRGYSSRYIAHKELKIYRDVFSGYELLAYLSVRAGQLGLRVTELPVERSYPKKGKTPTKISPIKGGLNLLKILRNTVKGKYNPVTEER